VFFNSITNPRKSFIWTIFHIVLAIGCTYSPYFLIFWFYLFFLTNFGNAIFKLRQGKYYLYVAILFYLVAFEMLGRLSKAYPFIPTELGKYFLLFFSFVGIITSGIRSKSAFLMFLLLIPAFFYDFSGLRTFVDIIYNILGPLATAAGIAFLYRSQVSQLQMNQILHLIWFTSLSALIFTFIKTPDFETITFTLGAQFETTADTPSNQVATILGMGMFLSFYSIINRLKFSGYRYFDIAIMLLFAFQGLISFSRGGMLIAAIGMVIIFFYNSGAKFNNKKGNIILGGVAALIGFYFIFQFANNISGGKLLQRYIGETEGTLLGSKEKTADVLVSGRLTIFNEDINLWMEHPITGVGAASSRFLRVRTKMVSPHVEFSRLLAEHGILGLMYFLILLFIYRSLYIRLSGKTNKGLFLALFVIAILSSFHAAMRTYLSPLFFILATLTVVPDQKIRWDNKK
jgi:O-antigen ligase